ncbi:hypothetical protein VM1G_01258 [Cytospora mali]|uniref:Uncharacterized protein n=1 Tax=Cytospora mali TaxID=578113 RepID=A0A194VN82_CYTMA|nr:hypothetical protein VM1G_01258 [Valsa mali]
MSPTGLVILGLLRAKGYVEGKISNSYGKQYQPYPIVNSPKFTSHDISVVCALLDPPKIFPLCLMTWLANDPKEIILVTNYDCYQNVLAALQTYNLTDEDRAKIKVFHLKEGILGQRLQHAVGFEKATGKIMAVTDDQILWSQHTLERMLPCFEDDQVGAAGGPLGVYLPPERRNPNVITPWEVAGTKFLFGGRGGGTAYWVADKWTWCLAGCTWLARTAIFQDPEFLDSFTSDQWNGKPLNSGGDNFITRYLHQHDHVVAVQYDDAATERNTLQSFWRFLREVPQTYRHPYVLYGTCNRLIRVPLGICHLAAWCHASYHHPRLTLAYLAYCIWKQYPGYKKFFKAYPYMLTTRNVLAAIACDYSWLIIGIWGLCTLSTDTWVHGDGNNAKEQPGVVVQNQQDIVEPADNAAKAYGDPLADGLTQARGAREICAPDEEPVPVSVVEPDLNGNWHRETTMLPTYQTVQNLFADLNGDESHLPYHAPLIGGYVDENGGVEASMDMVPFDFLYYGTIPAENSESALEDRDKEK